jgi:hypothetical protein
MISGKAKKEVIQDIRNYIEGANEEVRVRALYIIESGLIETQVKSSLMLGEGFYDPNTLRDMLIEEAIKKTSAYLDSIEKELGIGRIEKVVKLGDPAKEISNEAEEMKADEIFIIKNRSIFGSFENWINELSKKSHCPVIIAMPHAVRFTDMSKKITLPSLKHQYKFKGGKL